ncbi:restriction endonuclease subunit S [Trichodesmium erythraeum 21-75]|nr:restriction endonuclease subunit S [Trichodesmium erythraeum 21-75]
MVNLNWQKYPVYKSSGVEWLGDIPEHWEVNKLRWFVKIISSNVDKNVDPSEKSIKLCNYLDVYNNNFISSSINFMKGSANSNEIARYTLKVNDVIITKDSEDPNDIAIPALVTENIDNLLCGYHLSILRPLKSKINGLYLLFIIKSSKVKSQFSRSAQGITRYGLTYNSIKNVIITLPPLSEQQAIANFLDEKLAQIDEYIAKKQRIIELLKEQKTVIINQAVTKGINPDVPMKYSGVEWLGEIPEHWEVKKLKFIVLKIGSGKTPKGGGNVYSDSGVVFLRSQNIHFDRLRLDDVVYINQLIDSKMASTRVKPNDVLLNITGASLGRCQIIPKNFPPANVNQHVCIIRPNRKFIEPSFLFGIMASNAIQAQIFSSENGSSREGLNFLQIANFTLGMPPEISEQKEIALFIEKKSEKIERSLTVIEKEIKLTQEYRTTLISETVTGKIDVRKYHPPQ